MTRNYEELCSFSTYEERLSYLMLHGKVGADTFGFDRYMNQQFYRSVEWKRIRDFVIIRDFGRDMGLAGYEIPDGQRILVHHMNPISKADISEAAPNLMDPNYLVCVTKSTHDLIHYGIQSRGTQFLARSSGDTKLW